VLDLRSSGLQQDLLSYPFRGLIEELTFRQAIYPCEIFIAARWPAANAIEDFTGGATILRQADRDEN
jgi:hypothetical protein